MKSRDTDRAPEPDANEPGLVEDTEGKRSEDERLPRAVPAEEGDHSLKPHGDPLAGDPESRTRSSGSQPGSR